MQTTHLPIDAEARGKLRTLKAQLAKQYRRVEHQSEDLKTYAAHLCFKTGKGRDRTRARIAYAFGAGFHLEGAWQKRMLWVAFKPREGVILNPDNPSDGQGCICANYVIVGDLAAREEIGVCHGFWSIEFTDHAIGRMFQRDRNCDPIRVMREAHHAILSADTRLAHMRGGREDAFHLRAGNGAFVCNFIAGEDASNGGETMLGVQARTWLHNDQLDGRSTVVASPENPLGMSYLLPMPLRRLAAREIDGDPGHKLLEIATWHDALEPLARVP